VQVKVIVPSKLTGAHVPGEPLNYSPSDIQTFEVELAPLAEMPHATHLFLEQVSHGLWSKTGSSFYINQEHVLQAGPITQETRQHFVDYGLDKLAFPEYSNAFPHKQWTIGFAGRPGGPSFYINKINNSQDHGPFGQDHLALYEFADACFAKIVSGFSTIEAIIKETDSTHHTQIIGMEIINWKDHWTDGSDQHWKTAHEAFDDFDDDEVESNSNAHKIPEHSRIEDALNADPPRRVEPHKTPNTHFTKVPHFQENNHAPHHDQSNNRRTQELLKRSEHELSTNPIENIMLY
jgi:hypothetical protein